MLGCWDERKKDTGKGRRMYNMELHNCQAAQNNIQITESRKFKWERLVVSVGKRKSNYYWRSWAQIGVQC